MSYFKDKNYFGDDGTQNYLVLQPIQIYFLKLDSNYHISAWKSKGLSDESVRTRSAPNNILYYIMLVLSQ